MSLRDELGPPPRDPRAEFREAWEKVVTEARQEGRVDFRTNLGTHRPELLSALAQAGPEGLYVTEAARAVGASQPNITRALRFWVALDLVTRRQEEGDPKELRRALRSYYRLTDRGAELARLLEDS